VIVRFADIGEIADHHCLNFPTKKIDEPWNIGHHSFSDNDSTQLGKLCVILSLKRDTNVNAFQHLFQS
jgi:hypothetical protein